MSRYQKIVFAFILAVGAFLIFFRLGRQDMLSDEPLYAIRALHYFDYLASARQTTPVQWFGERPAWSYLSFHDHPPLFELIQHGFFRSFGDSVFVVRLTSALAALGSLIVMFFIGRRFGDARTGLLCMAALALNNYFIWIGRVGLLESLLIFWILLGLLFFIKALQDSPKFFLWSGVFFGIAFLTKYTVVFVLLPALFFLLIWQRRVFAQKHFWLGTLLFFLMISPVLVYNFKMLETRGHFDILFAEVLGQRQEDWVGMEGRVTGRQFALAPVLRTLAGGISWPYFVIFAVAFGGLAVAAWQEQRAIWWLPILITTCLFLVFSYIGSAARWIAVLAPFTALSLGIAVKEAASRRGAWLLGAVFGSYLLFFIFNTNHAIRPPANLFLTSPLRLPNLGYNQLGEKLDALLAAKRPDPAAAQALEAIWYTKIKKDALDFPETHHPEKAVFPYLIIYDDNMQYFPTVWLFERRKLYERFFIASSDEFLAYKSNEETGPILDSLPGHLGIFFIKTSASSRKLPEESYEAGLVEKEFEVRQITPEIVYDDQGREAFYLYDGLKL